MGVNLSETTIIIAVRRHLAAEIVMTSLPLFAKTLISQKRQELEKVTVERE